MHNMSYRLRCNCTPTARSMAAATDAPDCITDELAACELPLFAAIDVADVAVDLTSPLTPPSPPGSPPKYSTTVYGRRSDGARPTELAADTTTTSNSADEVVPGALAIVPGEVAALGGTVGATTAVAHTKWRTFCKWPEWCPALLW